MSATKGSTPTCITVAFSAISPSPISAPDCDGNATRCTATAALFCQTTAFSRAAISRRVTFCRMTKRIGSRFSRPTTPFTTLSLGILIGAPLFVVLAVTLPPNYATQLVIYKKLIYKRRSLRQSIVHLTNMVKYF